MVASTIRWHVVVLWSTGLTLFLLGPLLQPGYWLWADAVSVPRSFMSDQALGIAELAPRATPQDAFLAFASWGIDGGILVKVITVSALIAAGIGAARMVKYVLPALSRPTLVALVAATFSIDNLWVIERLLQGQWSLLVSYGALGNVIVVLIQLREQVTMRKVAEWGWWLVVGGIVPTGSLLILCVTFLVLALPGGKMSGSKWVGLGVLSLVGCCPWLCAGLVGLSHTALPVGDDAGVAVFTARPTSTEWWALGGIWNSSSVPYSQLGGWGTSVNILVGLLVVGGLLVLWRHSAQPTVMRTIIILAVVVIALVCFSRTWVGQASLEAVINLFPAAGILRDSHKWLALAWPAYSLGLAAVTQFIPLLRRGKKGSSEGATTEGFLRESSSRWEQQCSIASALMMLIFLCVQIPDAWWGLGGRLSAVRYPQEFEELKRSVAAESGRGAVLTIPVGITRRFDWAENRISLDPLPRFLPLPVVQSGDLIVETQIIPGEGVLARRAAQDVVKGSSSEQLARDSIGWIVVQHDQMHTLPDSVCVTLEKWEGVLHTESIDLYRNPVQPRPVPSVSRERRMLVLGAHGMWALMGIGCAGFLLLTAVKRKKF